MAHPTASVVIVEGGADSAQVLGSGDHSSDINYVLCCRPDECLERFSTYVFHRLELMSKNASITRISYLASPDRTRQLVRRGFLERLVGLLERGGDLELFAASSLRLDLLQAIEPLLQVAPSGVNVRAVRLPSVSNAPPGVETGWNQTSWQESSIAATA
jgi:hypothetical protein